MGGSADPQNPPQPEWFNYEALLLVDGGSALTRRVYPDFIAGTTPIFEWWGPENSSTANPYVASFTEYPKCHFLSNGRVFMAGDVPNSAQINHSFVTGTGPFPLETAAPWQQRWDTSAGAAGPASKWRHACASIYFGRIGSLTDMVVRIGGEDLLGPSDVCEACFATTPGQWFGAPAVPRLTIAREHANAVVLPDGSILVVGGEGASGPVTTPELFRWGTGQWAAQPVAASVHDYHSTAVLLPDASVLVGGGDTRSWDYEIFQPHYLAGSPPPVRPMAMTVFNPSTTDPDGTFVFTRPGGAAVQGFNVGSTLPLADYPIGFQLDKVVLISPGSTTQPPT